MAKCIKLVRTKTEVCIGSLNKRIDLYTRNITTPNDPTGFDVDYNEDFSILKSVWSMIQTPNGLTIFDAVGVEKVVSTLFYIRYISGLTSQNWIIYKNNRYDIQSVEDIEENRLFLKIFCIFRGDENLEATKA